MRSLTRDQWLGILLPTILVLGLYAWLWYTPRQADLTRALAARTAAEASMPTLQKQVVQSQARLNVLAQELKRLQADKVTARRNWETAAGDCVDPRLRNNRIEKLNALLARRGLRLLEDSQSGTGKEVSVAAAIDSLGKQLAVLSGKTVPQVRTIRMRGRYLDVVAALRDLASRDVVAIPVGLAMHEASLVTSNHEWILLVWI